MIPREKEMKKKHVALILALALLPAGCRGSTGGQAGVKVYYRKFVTSGLYSYLYTPVHTEGGEAVEELWKELCASDFEEERRSVVTGGVSLLRYSLDQKNLNLYFSEEYADQDNISELLLRAAAVMTFSQLEEVDTVSLFVGENPVTNSSSQPLGAQKASDYVDIIGSGLTDTKASVLTLYFADPEGSALVRTSQEAVYESAYSPEKDIVQKLIAGPADGSCAATLPDTLQLISIGIKDRVCYVNFDSSFITDALALDGRLIIYSIVNSLTELSGVYEVQFMVEGDTNISFRGISLDTPFVRNLNYVRE